MKTWKISLILLVTISTLLAFSFRRMDKPEKKKIPFVPPKGCVFRTLMGEESSDSSFVYKTPEKVIRSLDHGLDFIAQAQNKNGGWGAGSHSRQSVMDPHAVEADPATTAMVAMALLRNGNSLTKGKYSSELKKALEFLLQATEQSQSNELNITNLTGTQIQIKLGSNIDVILTAQFLSNILDETPDPALKARIEKNLNRCVAKIQHAQESNGSIAGAGWAGVLQSSFASNALEAAQAKGAQVDDKALERSRDFQKKISIRRPAM